MRLEGICPSYRLTSLNGGEGSSPQDASNRLSQVPVATDLSQRPEAPENSSQNPNPTNTNDPPPKQGKGSAHGKELFFCFFSVLKKRAVLKKRKCFKKKSASPVGKLQLKDKEKMLEDFVRHFLHASSCKASFR